MIKFSMSPMKNMREVWRDIPHYEDLYMVSSLGEVMRKHRVGTDRYGNRRVFPSMILRSNPIRRGGPLYVTLHRDGQGERHYVHRLVAFSFWEEAIRDPDYPVGHLDRDKENNRLDNLSFYLTREDFIQSPIMEKKLIQELSAPSSLLSPDDEEFIRHICRPGSKEFGMAVLAREYGVETKTIKQILEEAEFDVQPCIIR
ncbi:HNH endonuclease [Thermoactinomyces sp. DSM 45891]|uniref:NUMOD4 domain-containing protein n=1 Tax=Thermoactinomyces sp. DSM 45891 TaxID=1761907 RepID=UPI00091B536D|nr:NUMOD4 domain-containing protein [Thermoactinomyces sp. DSM 45891]SFX74850.1 HNH endonuclease [Thermoactinomyces sp. DSM 45891]